MKYTRAILVGCLAISLVGCSLRGAPKTVKATPPPPKPEAPPPPAPVQPLSIPQTNVELPKPQPLDPEALITVPPPEPAPEPVAPPPRRRSTPSASVPSPKPEAGPPPPEPEERPAIQEIIPAAEQKRLHDSLERRRAEINQILTQFNKLRQTALQRGVVRTIRSFVELADDAEKRGDVRQADVLAERAQVLARELQSGK
jgi:hypothetical protein